MDNQTEVRVNQLLLLWKIPTTTTTDSSYFTAATVATNKNRRQEIKLKKEIKWKIYRFEHPRSRSLDLTRPIIVPWEGEKLTFCFCPGKKKTTCIQHWWKKWKKLPGDKLWHICWWKGVFLSSLCVLLKATPPSRHHRRYQDVDELKQRWRDRYEARRPHPLTTPPVTMGTAPQSLSRWRRNCFIWPSRLWDTTCRFHIKPSRSPKSFISVKMKKEGKKKDTLAAGRKFWETTINSTVDVKSRNKFSELLVCSLVEPSNIQNGVLQSRPWNCGTNLVKKRRLLLGDIVVFFVVLFIPPECQIHRGKERKKRKEKQTACWKLQIARASWWWWWRWRWWWPPFQKTKQINVWIIK